jgi:Lrp/AsnC family transcriptional regulator, regulator for asnA, asnC and gidA
VRSGETFDTTDMQIIENLQEDGRRSYREISRGIGVSEATVRARVQRMQDAGVLRIVAFADPFALGDEVMALVFAKVRAADHHQVVDTLVALPQVSYVSSLIGSPYDLCIQIIGSDLSSLATWVRTTLDATPGVTETLVWVEHEVHKLQFRRAAQPASPRVALD